MLPENLNAALSIIADYLSHKGSSYEAEFDHGTVKFEFDKKSDMLMEEIMDNDKWGVLK